MSQEDASPLGMFERLGDGLAPAFARPLYKGLLSELEGPELGSIVGS
jgi:hypothetical protein